MSLVAIWAVYLALPDVVRIIIQKGELGKIRLVTLRISLPDLGFFVAIMVGAGLVRHKRRLKPVAEYCIPVTNAPEDRMSFYLFERGPVSGIGDENRPK